MISERVLNVFLHQRLIGTISLLSGDQNFFAFDEDYLSDPDRDTLSLSFKSPLGNMVSEIRPTRTRLPTFFSNLLPEGPLREYLAQKAGVSDKREFFLLKELGHDLPGSVTVEPSSNLAPRLQGSAEIATTTEKTITPFRFSLAGIQLKFSAIREATGGLTIPARGIGGSWIIKLPSEEFKQVPENEFNMMQLARRIGISTPAVELVSMKLISGIPVQFSKLKGNALAIKRFDRKDDNTHVHVEDFAQIFRVYPEKKYEKANYRNLAEVIYTESGEEDIVEFIRRLVFNVLIGNGDMHLKNWSLIYPDRKHARLSPAYDLLSTIPYIRDPNTALNLIRHKDMAGYSIERLSHFANKAMLSEKLVIETAKVTVQRFLEIWKNGEYIEDMPFLKEAISEHLKTIQLVKEV